MLYSVERVETRDGKQDSMKGVLHVSRWNPKLEGQPHKLSKLPASQDLLTEGISLLFIVGSWDSENLPVLYK